MYRAVVYYAGQRATEDGVALMSAPLETAEAANRLLLELQELPGVTGGLVEAKVPGVGWVLIDEAETIAWLVHTSQ